MQAFRRAVACCVVLAAVLSSGHIPAAEKEPGEVAPAVEQPELRKELLVRETKDQEVRQKLLDWVKRNKLSFDDLAKGHLKEPVLQEQIRVDRENCEWLKTVVARHGWPGRTLVGEDGAHAAWLLAQHADHESQRDLLRRMQQCPAGEVAKIDLAYLTDRVLLAEGKRQRYGTQIEARDGRWQPKEVEDPGNLDRRRKEIGLPPIAGYLKDAEQVYGLPGGGEKKSTGATRANAEKRSLSERR